MSEPIQTERLPKPTFRRPHAHDFTPEQVHQLRTAPPANLNLIEAGVYIGIGKRAVVDLIKSGQIRARFVGKRYIVSKVSIDAYLAA